jgi:hypothetical protein
MFHTLHMFLTFHQYPHPNSHYQPLNAKAFIEIAIFDTLVALFKGSGGKLVLVHILFKDNYAHYKK